MGKKKCSSIGGQAVIEGVMMRGNRSMATAVRDEKGNIVVESKYIKPVKEKNFLFRTPFLRGVFNFIGTMISGMGTLMRSGEVFEGETQPSKTERWFAKKLGVNVYNLIMGVAVVIGLALSFALFFFLPQMITKGICLLAKIDQSSVNFGIKIALNLMEGVVRILIFIGYIALTRLMKDVKRTYMYHGAEHKTISCYEHGLDLTVENARTMSTQHDRCGTTFMFIVMVISVLVLSFFGWWAWWINLLIRVAALPIIMGVSYEILKFLARFDNWFVRALKAPGLWLQKLTTIEPTDDMLEVAITAFETVREMDENPALEERYFDTNKPYRNVREEIDKILEKVRAEACEGDWIMCFAMGVKRSDLANITHIKLSQYKKALKLANKRAEGIPLWQVLESADFYGIELKINDKVLCPRPETEYLTEQVIERCKEIPQAEVLDLCTGSGCIAIAVAVHTDAKITASDLSQDALEIAAQNVKTHNLQERITLIRSDLFEALEGKFDVIVSNPPYIPTAEIASLETEVRDHEPHTALDGGADGLDFYRRIVAEAHGRLKKNGMLAFEVGKGQAEAVREMMERVGYACRIVKDLEGTDRIVIGTLRED